MRTFAGRRWRSWRGAGEPTPTPSPSSRPRRNDRWTFARRRWSSRPQRRGLVRSRTAVQELAGLANRRRDPPLPQGPPATTSTRTFAGRRCGSWRGAGEPTPTPSPSSRTAPATTRIGSVRRAAVQELARGWRTDADTLPILKDRARNDEHWGVRRAAVQELARGWRTDPETLAFLEVKE